MPRWMQAGYLVLAVSAGCSGPRSVAPTPSTEATTPIPIELRAVKIAELNDEIAKQKGKVVLIDIWFRGCAPCVKRFPKFVELHRELKAEGLVCISLDVYVEELKTKDKVLEFLKEQGADTINLIVDDTEKALGDWQEKYDAVATPSYVIFNRQGEWVKTPQPEDKYNVSKLLKKLLAEK